MKNIYYISIVLLIIIVFISVYHKNNYLKEEEISKLDNLTNNVGIVETIAGESPEEGIDTGSHQIGGGFNP